MCSLHPALPDGLCHGLHGTGHFDIAIVIANPDGCGILGGVASHPTVFGIVGRTGLHGEFPGALIAIETLGFAAGREVAGVRIA